MIHIQPSEADMDSQAHAHTRFAEEIAERVEQRIIAKFAKWLIINLGVLLGAIAVGISGYYAHDAKLTNLAQADTVFEKQLVTLATEHHTIRTSLTVELREINSRLDEINRYLRDRKP
jgi:uncharacterized protein HemX